MLFSVFVIVLVAVTIIGTGAAKFADNVEEHFANFKSKFGRSYATPEEETMRKEVFRQAMQRVDQKNERNGSPVFGVTKFSDWTEEEFSVLLGRKGHGRMNKGEYTVRQPKDSAGNLRALAALPTYVNWASQGKVTPVKNQGQCGSCWAFSVASEIESQWAMNGNPIWEFSPQQVASCTSNCYGCGGGDTTYGYEYLMNVTGLGSAWFAPYVQSMVSPCSTKKCTESCSSIPMSQLVTSSSLTGPYAKITGYTYAVPPCTDSCSSQDTSLLASNLATYGPVSICLDASSWNDYTGGVMTLSGCGGYAYSDVDHCVQLVGYNAGATNPYWLVRNQWASNWGENGYILLQYPSNTCGLANEATFVTIGNSQANF